MTSSASSPPSAAGLPLTTASTVGAAEDPDPLGLGHREVGALDAEPAARDRARLDQLGGHAPHQVDGRGEAEPGLAAGQVRGDADDGAAGVHQRAAGPGRLDRRVGLDQAVERLAVGVEAVLDRAHHARW